MPEVANFTENVVIPTLSAGILCQDEWLEYRLQYFIQHLSVCLMRLIEVLLSNIAVLVWNR
jgi:hypothetical protein